MTYSQQEGIQRAQWMRSRGGKEEEVRKSEGGGEKKNYVHWPVVPVLGGAAHALGLAGLPVGDLAFPSGSAGGCGGGSLVCLLRSLCEPKFLTP